MARYLQMSAKPVGGGGGCEDFFAAKKGELGELAKPQNRKKIIFFTRIKNNEQNIFFPLIWSKSYSMLIAR